MDERTSGKTRQRRLPSSAAWHFALTSNLRVHGSFQREPHRGRKLAAKKKEQAITYVCSLHLADPAVSVYSLHLADPAVGVCSLHLADLAVSVCGLHLADLAVSVCSLHLVDLAVSVCSLHLTDLAVSVYPKG